MNYNSKFNLLQDTQKQMMRDLLEAERVGLNHQGGKSSFWPSAVSIAKSESSHNCTYETIEGQCLRQYYYRMTGQSQTNAPAVSMFDVWDIGTSVENIYKERFCGLDDYRVIFPTINGKKLKFSNPKTKLSGEADLILEHKVLGLKFGVEMKSYYGFWACMEVCGYDVAEKCYSSAPYIRVDDPARTKPPFPKLQNLLQTCLYLEEFWDDGIQLFKLIYVPRDKGATAEFDVTLTEYNGLRCAEVNGVIVPWVNLEAIHKRYQDLKTYLDNSQLPPCDYINEYDNDYIMTGTLPLEMSTWHKVKHMDWREEVTRKSQNARTPKNKKLALANAQTIVKRDWQCSYCPYLTRCLSDSGKMQIF